LAAPTVPVAPLLTEQLSVGLDGWPLTVML